MRSRKNSLLIVLLVVSGVVILFYHNWSAPETSLSSDLDPMIDSKLLADKEGHGVIVRTELILNSMDQLAHHDAMSTKQSRHVGGYTTNSRPRAFITSFRCSAWQTHSE